MTVTFERLYRQLGRATIGTLYVALAFLGLALGCALLGFGEPVESFVGAAKAAGYVFAGLMFIFLVAYLLAAFVRFLDRRRNPVV